MQESFNMLNDFTTRAKKIKLAVFDIDGVMTDGRLYFLADGSEFKSFNTLDGLGIKMLMQAGIETAVITGRSSIVVERRINNLGIQHYYHGREDKLTALDELLAKVALDYENVAYLGDDLPDLAAIRKVGVGMAVANANAFVKQHALSTTKAAGGHGAVREFCELLLLAQGQLMSIQQQYL